MVYWIIRYRFSKDGHFGKREREIFIGKIGVP